MCPYQQMSKKKSNSIGWVLDSLTIQQTERSETKKIKSREGHMVKSIPVDMAIRKCPKCRVAWERVYHSGMEKVKYYYDFPTIGKKKIICPNCRKKKGIE